MLTPTNSATLPLFHQPENVDSTSTQVSYVGV